MAFPLDRDCGFSLDRGFQTTNAHDRARLYELLIQELEDFAVFLVDLDGRIASWNPGVERFFGYQRS
jgi:PAS domain-containing protein